MIYRAVYHSPLGEMYMVSDGKNLMALDFVEVVPERPLGEQAEKLDASLPVFATVRQWLDSYFQGGRPDFLPPLSLEGTPFRRAVWDIMRRIPYGMTVSYGKIAADVADILGKRRMSAQAVGGAVGHNPIAIIVPCHRVVGSDGSLTGYAGGLWRKKYLLELEGIHGGQLAR
ncbi:methylated-DNA--[protein]-cysteine S-methyltransferase [Selenomonas ruminis]|uniref:Methylated-DNA--protein-cysteine methyltransferase n=2 Tax=Selenomonas TaxID=970 RepID=A0A5D6W9L2_9FIRM|nr:methylated-DNA--[protein]-cysteine S-methyltransferase [Selenomonas sp. mPRGC5]TYZ24586.1 methylated-DNA--[protein]-cysteine S-methyltransferase [Selenomonas sp. mPRGC5]